MEFCGVQKGSRDHAEQVLKRAEDLFSSLGKNTFRPKVLAMVSWNGSWFVGSSMAVSQFLRPHCLHNRIIKFKVRLQEALVFVRPLCPRDDQATGWSSSAFMKNEYAQGKAPCKNCQIMFQKLGGFIDATHHTNDNNNAGSSFIGACAEYCPVNELLTDEATVSATDTSLIDLHVNLKRHKNQCSRLFEDYCDIADKAFDALDDSLRVKAVAREIQRKVHIFGFKPECKM